MSESDKTSFFMLAIVFLLVVICLLAKFLWWQHA